MSGTEIEIRSVLPKLIYKWNAIKINIWKKWLKNVTWLF